MPAIATLAINDGQAAPVSHNYDPVTTDGSQAKWADRSPTIPSGFRTISHEVLPPANGRTVHKITCGFYIPVVATVAGVDTVVRYSSGQVILNVAADSLLQERKDLLAYVANFLGNATVKTSIQNLEPFY
jgi:hypothetical protein